MITENLSINMVLNAVASPLLVCRDNTIVYANPAAEKLLGYSTFQLLERTVDSFIYVTSSKAFTSWYAQRLVSTGKESVDVRFMSADHSLIWVKLTALATVFEEKNLQILTMQDITHVRKMETDLYLSKTYRDMLMTNNSDVVIVTDDAGSISYVSPSIQAALGYTANVVLDHSWDEWVHEEDKQLVLQAMKQIRQDHKTFPVELRIQNSGGDYIWFECLLGLVYQVDNEQITLISAARNIHKHKLTELALREREQRLRLITDNMQDIVLEIDSDGLMRYLSPSCLSIMGYQPEELLGRSHLEHVYPEDIPPVLEYFSQALTQPTRTPFELRFRHKNGHYLWMEIIYKTVSDDKGDIQSIVISAREVSNRKEAQAALLQSQHLLQHITTMIPLDIYIYDVKQERNVFFNRTENMGYPVDRMDEDHSGAFYTSLVHPDDLAKHRQNAERLRVARDGELLESEYRMKHASGEWRWYYFRDIVFARNPDGTPSQFLGSIQDITARKQIEAALRQSRHMFQQVAETVPMQIFIYDLESKRNLFENHPPDFGYPDEVLLTDSKSYYNLLIHPDDRPVYDETMRQLYAASDGQIFENEFRVRAVDGHYRWRYYRYTSFARNPDGSLRQFLGTFQDIDERKKAEQDLRENEEKLRLITDNIHDLVALTDETMRYRYVTPSHLQILGYKPEELLGKSIFDMVHPDDVEMVQNKTMAAIEKRQADSAEFRFRHHDGYYLWMETNGSLAIGADGELSGAIFASRDVSERRWMQRAMLEQEKLLVMLQKEQELSSLKTRMMSRLSHELRTPLAVISTSADLLDTYGKRMTEEQRVERLQQIKTQVKHFTGMLDNMALVVKGISYSMDFAPSPYNLESTATTVISELKELLHAQHEVILQLNGEMSVVNSDEQLMRLILTHLLANALKYSPPTKPIIITATLLPETITVSVQDQGVGILPEESERIFDAFFRGTNINEVPGLGVGLSIVKDAVDSMEGKIEVESQIGVGTTVTVHIPLGGVIGVN